MQHQQQPGGGGYLDDDQVDASESMLMGNAYYGDQSNSGRLDGEGMDDDDGHTGGMHADDGVDGGEGDDEEGMDAEDHDGDEGGADDEAVMQFSDEEDEESEEEGEDGDVAVVNTAHLQLPPLPPPLPPAKIHDIDTEDVYRIIWELRRQVDQADLHDDIRSTLRGDTSVLQAVAKVLHESKQLRRVVVNEHGDREEQILPLPEAAHPTLPAGFTSWVVPTISVEVGKSVYPSAPHMGFSGSHKQDAYPEVGHGGMHNNQQHQHFPQPQYPQQTHTPQPYPHDGGQYPQPPSLPYVQVGVVAHGGMNHSRGDDWGGQPAMVTSPNYGRRGHRRDGRHR